MAGLGTFTGRQTLDPGILTLHHPLQNQLCLPVSQHKSWDLSCFPSQLPCDLVLLTSSWQPLHKARPGTQLDEEGSHIYQTTHCSQPAATDALHAAFIGAPLKHIALVTEGTILLGCIGHLPQKAAFLRSGNATNLPDKEK